MVKQKLFLYIAFFMNISSLDALPIMIAPNVTFDVKPEVSEVTKLILNENYDEDKIQKFLIDDIYLNINLSGFNCGYSYKLDKNKIKNNYVRLRYNFELVSHNNSQPSAKIKRIEIHSADNITVINNELTFREMEVNFYNKSYYSCTTELSRVEFILSPSKAITFLVCFEINGQEHTIAQEYQITRKKHLIELLS